mgnify:CR=1 FL=1
MLNLERIKDDFPQTSALIDGKRITYLDSAATNLKYKGVIDATSKYYSEETANVHRGIHTLSEINKFKSTLASFPSISTIVSPF